MNSLKSILPNVILILIMVNSTCVNSQECIYEQSFSKLKNILDGTSDSSFKEALFLSEYAMMDGELQKEEFDQKIEDLKLILNGIIIKNNLSYDLKDRDQVLRSSSIFILMRDTIELRTGQDTFYHFPYQYNFDDPICEISWKNTLVNNLLDTFKGNCRSLAFLYKILADEIGIEAHLALAPHHIYIKQRSEKTGMYNIELTNASFPIDAWIMASGYIHLDAIRNGIYMKALNEKESKVLCVLDLALGYNRKFPDNDGSLILKCVELALVSFPNFINAHLLKAKTLKKQIDILSDQGISQSQRQSELWRQMEKTYETIHKLGYRQMPKEMYLDWIGSLEPNFNARTE